MLTPSAFKKQSSRFFDASTHLLLAVSGGIDSVVLCHLMHTTGYRFEIAHCNFQLRGTDSDRDEAFVRRLADRYGVPCHVARFDTRKFAKSNHLSIEDAARRLRYDYFAQILNQATGQSQPSCLATAHHRDDAVETFFLNLLRGTGIAGLHGIRPVSCWTRDAGPMTVVRPLIAFSREEIEQYAGKNGLEHVEDVTNHSLEYRRNRIRHQLMPLLRELVPTADKAIEQTMRHLSDTEQIYRQTIETVREDIVRRWPGCDRMDIGQLQSLQPRDTWLFELLQPYGFNAAQVNDIQASLDRQPGRLFYSPTHRLVRERGDLVVSPLPSPDSVHEVRTGASVLNAQFSILNYSREEYLQLHGTFCTGLNQAIFDADRLRQPLQLRHWQRGDRFQPFGMKGSRLLSDFFSDLKLSRHEREIQWLLCDADDQVLWVVGRRTDGRWAVRPDTQRILSISLHE